MRSRRALLAILCVLASLLVPAIASASSAAGADTRVWAFGLSDKVRVEGAASLTSELHPGCAPTYDQLASDSLLAAKGGPNDGSYTNTHASGKTYDGKGGTARSQRSGQRIANEHNDPHVATDHTPAANTREAFKDEARRLEKHGGPDPDKNYNKINSPGKKYIEEDGQ